ncbi:nitronate monooxygenase [Powellomyces hirtus]|uniref:Nitronate monooxygenase n=1 Tax=Powellomyces hirtus TaxID=109895 RepID=A0A507DW36_9FUNG|nr:nitronate monooxygenase [Powellomyces hirtus]
MPDLLATPITKLFGIQHPILLAGMNVAAGPELAAAVSNAGGLGVIGGVGYTPDFLRQQIKNLKSYLKSPNLPFGIDLLLPQVGGSARKTNYDYTEGHLPELIDIICESGAKLFVSAIGVPPRWAVDKLHKAKIPVMNMVGAPKHVEKAIAAGVDIICAQGGEGGGHTGDVPTSILIPKVVDICRNHKSPLTGGPISVVAAGGIYDGRGLAMSLCMGADAVWVGTRFVCAKEAGAPPRHQQAIINAGYHDTIRTVIYTGRPMRVLKNEYIMEWEETKQDEIRELTSKGVVPAVHDVEERSKKGGDDADPSLMIKYRPLLMGQVAGAIMDIKPAKEIVDEMVTDAVKVLKGANGLIQTGSRL